MNEWNFYERNHWEKENDMKVSNKEAEMVVKKLSKHFKLSIRYVEFYGFRDSGMASSWSGRIRLSNNPSVHVICHEVCHFLCWKKVRQGKFKKHPQHGSKKWLTQLKVVHNYVIKHNYWKEEFERRTQPKEPKPEPTKQELRIKKLKQLEDRKQKYERRIRLSENRIKKINRQI